MIIIHQVTYGPRGKGHTILDNTLKNTDILDDLERKLDLPFSFNPGVPLGTFISGTPINEEYYLISKTTLIESARRIGSVFSHGLILKKSHIEKVKQLKQLFALLLDSPSNNSLDVIYFNEKTEVNFPISTSKNRIAKLAKSLVSNNEKPTIWLGQSGFYEAIHVIWENLLENHRRSFSFRLSLGPEDVRNQGLNAVCTPEKNKNSWYDHDIIKIKESKHINSKEVDFLTGADNCKKIREFSKELNVIMPLYNLSILFRYFDQYDNIDQLDTSQVISLYRFISSPYIPKGKGESIKIKVTEKLKSSISNATFQDIKSIRNLEVNSGLQLHLKNWIKNNTHFLEKTEIEFLLKEIINKKNWWQQGVVDGLKTEFTTLNDFKTKFLWKFWNKSLSSFHLFIKYIETTKENENFLKKNYPANIKNELAHQILSHSKDRGWHILHACALLSLNSPFDALTKQLKLDEQQNDLRGLNIVLEKISFKNLAKVFIQTKDGRLIKPISLAGIRQPVLFDDIDISNILWQEILLYTISIDSSALERLSNSTKILFDLLDLLLAKKPIKQKLLNFFSKSDYNNLLEYKNRTNVWKILPYGIKNNFLKGTASAWIDRFITDVNSVEKIEEYELKVELLKQVKKALGIKGKVPVSSSILLFRLFRLYQADFIKYLDIVSFDAISEDEAQAIGLFINKKEWDYAYKKIQSFTPNRNALIAIQECTFIKKGLIKKFEDFLLNETSNQDKKLDLILKNQEDVKRGMVIIMGTLVTSFKEIKNGNKTLEEKIIDFHNSLDITKTSPDIEAFGAVVQSWLPKYFLLKNNSQTYLKSGKFILDTLTKAHANDYSPFVLQFCRVVEYELSESIFKGFKSNYDSINGTGSLDAKLNSMNSSAFASAGVTGSLKGKVKKMIGSFKKNQFMLGPVIHAFHILNDPLSLGIDWIADFHTYIINDFDPKVLDSTFINNIDVIRESYRNKAAHPEIISRTDSINCKNAIQDFLKEWIDIIE